MATFYIDSDDFLTATAVYTTATLVTKASDGFYSDGKAYREQSSGLLLPVAECPSCPITCGTLVSVTSVVEGVYKLTFNAGATTGAIAVEFDPSYTPKGISATFDGTVYTEVIADGVADGGSSKTFVGDTANDCGISGKSFSLPVYKYGASSFISTDTAERFFVSPDALNLSTGAPSTTRIIIPKPSATPTDVEIAIYMPCADDTDFDIRVQCPVTLTGFDVDTTVVDNAGSACGLGGTYGGTYYNYPINGSAGVPAVGDVIFTDANGATKASSGFYNFDNGGNSAYMNIDENGLITAIEDCDTTVFVSANALGEGIQTVTLTTTE